ncbi:MAG: co-chaperone GroES [Candidatus Peribacteraceae bacterium]|nr:co-chaperone GroES [Candidatus Peribacteraceae bacterium]
MASSSHTLPKLAIQIEPLGDRVVVMPVEKETTTKSGIVIPDTASGEKPQEGVVLAMGNGKMKFDGKELSNPKDFLKVGDRILYGKYSGDEVKLKTTDGKDVEVKVLRLDSILGKIAA